MKKILLSIILITTNIFANINDVIISENYIPQEHCTIIKEIRIDDNKTATKDDIYKQLRIKAYKLGGNAVLNTTYHTSIFTNYISGDTSSCDLELSPSLKSKKIELNSKDKFSKSFYKYPLVSEVFSTTGIEIGFTSSMEGTMFGGLSYGTKSDYELYGHLVYLEDKNTKTKDLGYSVGLRHYLFANSKYKNIRLTLNYGIQDFTYKNGVIKQENGINLGLGYVWDKSSGLGFDIFYKAIDSAKNAGIKDHVNFMLGYKF